MIHLGRRFDSFLVRAQLLPTFLHSQGQCEELNMSKSGPLYSTMRTSTKRADSSQKGQIQTTRTCPICYGCRAKGDIAMDNPAYPLGHSELELDRLRIK